MDRRIIILITVGALAMTSLAVWWFMRPPQSYTNGVPADHWQWTGSCYVAVGSPTTLPPGEVCDGATNTVSLCHYNGQDYAIGERFAAADGCNTCTCDAATRSVVCTEIACVQEPT